ncbi:MAG: NAD regulator [Hyphomicrobiales bacterium]|nr:NAD regulator [Hyphomicrobiales bacterium]
MTSVENRPTLPVEINLTAAIIAVSQGEPSILVTRHEGAAGAVASDGLPSGPFHPLSHRTFEIGLRSWVSEQTGVPLGYVEQLYTFGDRGRHAEAQSEEPHIVSVGYLALTRKADYRPLPANASFRSCYHYLPWEDWRSGKPRLIEEAVIPALQKWTEREPTRQNARGLTRADRLRILFDDQRGRFDDETVLDRYEMLYEAGLVEEAKRDGRASPLVSTIPPLGAPMLHDHRRILATALGRLRAKMKYRPVIFELMPERFTLTALQTMAEAISGHHLHKQNFRRFVENAAVVEPTGETEHGTGGRPAALFRFRREVLQERPAQGLRVGARG